MADTVYKCLNPVGIQNPVDTFPLAPRLDTLDGKEIYFNFSGLSEQDITIPLETRLKSDYPNVTWKIKKIHGSGSAAYELSEEERKTCDALIQGVAW